MNTKLGFVLLAAGKGTRMHSDSPKVLQTVLGKPLLGYVFDALIFPILRKFASGVPGGRFPRTEKCSTTKETVIHEGDSTYGD